ncbi:MAG: PASTA domain-containing protein [Bacteroidetes bacterium]|jgi:beta-lactam-binding protein with PASTA domain|nr:PASTA domain-containing protein [Bacteroidota bacterium]
MPFLSVTQSTWSWLTSLGRGTLALLKNLYFWAGLIVLLLLLLSAYLLVDRVIMPDYTRHDVAVQVPSVTDRPFDEAVEILSRYDLDVERETQEFNPNVAREVVVDQRPRGQALVKPGRRVYLTVNAGDVQQVTMPSLDGLSIREARNRVRALGLTINEELPDSIPSAYRNTITGHEPAAGDSLAEGSGVTLYYSTGLGEQYVEIPDITGMTVAEAREELLSHRLRAFIINGGRDTEEQRDIPIDSLEVVAQSREPGTRMREGSEVRLSIEPQTDE